MEYAQSYNELLVWKKAHQIVLDMYKMTHQLPKEELFGLTSQIRRSAISIPANLAEGFGRKGKKDKMRFYHIAYGSLNETDYYLLLINDLNYYNTSEIKLNLHETTKMLSAYIKQIEKSIQS